MADFNFYLNRQGIQGVQGEKGDQGYSPTVEVDTNTAAEYILKITTEDNEFYTPNLRGSAVEDLGGTYMRYDPDTQQMFAGPPDYATEDEWGVVQLATDDDITGASTTKVVTAERITDINATLAEHESTMTTMQTEIESISGDIPVVNNGVLTITQGTTPLGSFTANSSTDVTVNIPTPVTPNNGTLTIQKNGSTVGTFNADSSTNVTADITVPTQLSDLSDGSTVVTQTTLETALQDYVETTTLATVATSGNYNDLSNKPTIPAGVTITTTLTSQSTNEEVPGAKATYDWLNELTTTQTNQETRLSTVEDEYFDKRTDLKSSITSTDTTGAPTPAAVYDFVTGEISDATSTLVTQSTLTTEITNATQNLVDTTTLTTAITAATSTMVTSTTVRQIVQLTQVAYDALTTPDANTFYVIIG